VCVCVCVLCVCVCVCVCVLGPGLTTEKQEGVGRKKYQKNILNGQLGTKDLGMV